VNAPTLVAEILIVKCGSLGADRHHPTRWAPVSLIPPRRRRVP